MNAFTGLILGYFDYAFLFVFAAANCGIIRRSKPIPHKVITGALLILAFGLVLPAVSMGSEIHWPVVPRGTMTEAFNLLYTYFRFPLYWGLGLVQLAVFLIRRFSLARGLA